ncbi:MAG: VOC family protein [Steroidobacteraceae bacterium]
MASADVQGKFLWHELVTADPAAAGAFYGKVLGWTPQAWNKDPSYTVLLTPKGPVGGMMKPGADTQSAGSSAHWMSYVGAANVEETAATAQRLGGRLVKGASDIPGGGRYAVLADPQGAVFGIHTPPAGGSGSHASDAFAWHELTTSDHASALRFYRELFGWEQIAVHDMGAMGPYVLFGRGGHTLGGMFSRQDAGPHWLAYVRVSSASRAADAAKAAGGRVINGPHQVPGGSWTAQLADPHGAAIAVNQPEAAAESAQPQRPAGQSPKPAARPAAAQAPAPAAERRPLAAAPAASASAAASAARAAVHSAVHARPASAAAHPASTTTRPAPAKPAARAKVAAPAKAARKAKARKSSARKSAARAGASRKKKTARPARRTTAARRRTAKKSTAKKSTAKKSSAARSRRGAASRSVARSASARAGGRRAAAGARKAARGKRAKKRAARR